MRDKNQRYLSVDGLYIIKHKIPELSTVSQRESYLPLNYKYYELYNLDDKGHRIGVSKVTKSQHEEWLIQ